MATCESLQPVVLLTDVMESNRHETSMVFPQGLEKNSQLFQVEQTEPLNLCLNGGFLNDFTVTQCCSKRTENQNIKEQRDDDVIFVKEYKVKRSNGQRNNKDEPRRNPARKARDIKRFQEYADVDFYDDSFLSESADEENSMNNFEKIDLKNEDSEDWKIENIPRKGRQRRRIINKKFSHKLGRKRKINRVKEQEETKEVLDELEPILKSNLLLIKDYISDLKVVKKLSKEKDMKDLQTCEDVTKQAVNLFKQQVLLLTVVKDIDNNDLLQCINEWIM